MEPSNEPKFFDPSIRVKKKLVDGKFQFIKGTDIPLPSEVEISESGTCNRVCSFCPRSDPNYPDVKEFIKDDLHDKLCNELNELGFSGTVRYSGFVEPLLDKNIYNLIKQAKNILKNANIEMVTNGDVLSKKRLLKLFESGLDRLLISVYDTQKDIKKFNKLADDCNLTEKVIVRDRTLPPEQDFGITLSNRAGMLKNAKHQVLPLKEKLNKACYYPAYTFFMDYNGDVLMCAHDWGKKRILGNLNKSSFIELWTSNYTKVSRSMLISGNRSISPCNICDVNGTLIGKKHVDAWKIKYEKKK